jgi:hypothetical protein
MRRAIGKTTQTFIKGMISAPEDGAVITNESFAALKIL